MGSFWLRPIRPDYVDSARRLSSMRRFKTGRRIQPRRDAVCIPPRRRRPPEGGDSGVWAWRRAL